MLKKLIIMIIGFCLLFAIMLNSFAANIIYDFEGEEFENYLVDKIVEELDLEEDCLSGPQYDEIKKILNTADNMEVLKYIDEHYEDVLNNDCANIVIPDHTKLRVGKGTSSSEDKVRYGRNRKIDTVIRVREKNEVAEQNKADREETKKRQEGNKITIYVKSLSSNKTNPENGVAYKMNHVFYTECGTLLELMNAEGLTDETDFINTIDGISSGDTLEEEYSDDGKHGKWVGNYWCLYVNGKKSDVGADLVELEDGMRIKWIEITEETKW